MNEHGQGVARIVSDEGDGAYTITQQWWNPASSGYDDAVWPAGLEQAEARDFLGRGGGQEDQLVRFWTQEAKGGHREVLIDLGGPPGVFPAKILTCPSAGTYTAREQVRTGEGTLGDKSGAETITIRNLSELSGGASTSAVPTGEIVLVTAVGADYWFDRPTNALYKA